MRVRLLIMFLLLFFLRHSPFATGEVFKGLGLFILPVFVVVKNEIRTHSKDIIMPVEAGNPKI